jgi:hypothetical protein
LTAAVNFAILQILASGISPENIEEMKFPPVLTDSEVASTRSGDAGDVAIRLQSKRE